MKVKLLTAGDRARLTANAAIYDGDHRPVIKLFTPDANATWLLTELHTDGRLFGLCDLGMGCPELGYVALEELESVRGPLGLPVERDRHWKATAPLSAYADAAREAGHIIDRLPDPKPPGGAPPAAAASALLTAGERAMLLKNALAPETDHCPVARLHAPPGKAVWLITEMDAEGTLFGLIDYGTGTPDLGTDTLADLEASAVIRDRDWTPSAGLFAYLAAAKAAGRIVEPPSAGQPVLPFDPFDAAMARLIGKRVKAARQRNPKPTPEEIDARAAQIAALRADVEASGVMAPLKRGGAIPPPTGPLEGPDLHNRRVAQRVFARARAERAARTRPQPAPAPAPLPDPERWPDPADLPKPWTPASLAERRSAAARKAIANRDRFAAGRKAAETRRARQEAQRAPAPPPAFPDWVSERLGTRRWAIAPVKPTERPLFDRILSPDWYRALRDAYRHSLTALAA